MTAPTRTPRRRIVRHRTLDSRFKVGQHVTVQGHASGDYHGTVVATHRHLQLVVDTYTGRQATLPGVTVCVHRWEGVDHDGAPGTAHAPFDIVAHDGDTSRRAPLG
jgi:hypothetical protein